MIRANLGFLSAVLFCAVSQAQTVNTTLTVTASGTLGTTITANGTANLTGIGTGLAFSATVSLTNTDSSGNYTAPFTITFNNGDKLNGTLSIPAAVLTGASATAKATITGGTGAYAGATGSFPSLTGSGALTATGFSLSFTGAGTITTGGSGGGGTSAPVISAVLDAGSNTPGVAPGSIFIVKGTGLSASGYTPYDPPRPKASPGTNIKVTFTPAGGGSGTDAYLWYLYNQGGVNQIAAILPSTVTPGNYNVTVTNGTASAPFPTTVLANKLTIFTQDATGSGQGSILNFINATTVDLNRLTTGSVSGTTISPAHPGQPVLAFGTGLGAYAPGDDDQSKALFDYRSTLTITAIVGGMSIPVDYAGLAGYPGEDQINFTLPANVPTGCGVTLQFSVNGKLSPPVSISIAPDPNATACVMPGYTSAQLQKLDQGGTITSGAFSMTQYSVSDPSFGTIKSNLIAGGFAQITAFQLSSAAQGNVNFVQQGSCTLIQSVSTGTSTTSGGRVTYLDAGNITATGPAGSSLNNTALNKTLNSYSLTSTEGISIPGQTNFSLPAGTYTLNGAGGTDVGAFTATLTTGTPLTVTGGLPASITRSAGLTLNWTGGNASDLVEIVGGTTSQSGSAPNTVTTSTEFICLTNAGQRTFLVPASILNQMPATTGTDTGFLDVASGATSTFTAPLKAGGTIDFGAFVSFTGTGGTVKFQ